MNWHAVDWNLVVVWVIAGVIISEILVYYQRKQTGEK